MRNFHIVISVALAISAIFTEPLLGQELIDNGHFDTGIEGWIADEFPDGGTIAWASDPGQPPGALKFVGDGQVARPTECFQFTVAGELTYSMDVFMETTGDFFSCTLNLNLYKDANEVPEIFLSLRRSREFSIYPKRRSPINGKSWFSSSHFRRTRQRPPTPSPISRLFSKISTRMATMPVFSIMFRSSSPRLPKASPRFRW